jgi:hypothetical protein
MNEDFNNNDIARYAQEAIVNNIKEDFKPEAKKVPYIWLLRPLKKDIISAINSSIYKDDIDEEIYFWSGNTRKYFVTDKGVAYSISIYKTNYKEEIDDDTFNEMLYTDYQSIAQLEDARAEAKATGTPFICRQLRRLKPDRRQLDLLVKNNIDALAEKGYSITKKFNDATCRYDYYVKISYNEFVDIVLHNKEVVTKGKAGRKGKEFAILAKGIITVYKNKKDCYEKLFADICNEKTFKRAIKGKGIGDTFVIKSISYAIVENPSELCN